MESQSRELGCHATWRRRNVVGIQSRIKGLAVSRLCCPRRLARATQAGPESRGEPSGARSTASLMKTDVLPERIRFAFPFAILTQPDTVRLIAGEEFRYTLRSPSLDQWLPRFLRGFEHDAEWRP